MNSVGEIGGASFASVPFPTPGSRSGAKRIASRLPVFSYAGGRHADPVPDAAALAVRSLRASHPGMEHPALDGVSLRIPSGTRVALVGPNGSGKSTLLKAVVGLLRPESGSILVHGNPVGACHHRVAYLPQRGEIDWRFPINVRKLVMTGRYVHLGWLKRPGREDHELVHDILARLGIEDLSSRQIGQLSGGQQQRALLARSLAQGSDLLLLDEPLAAVDAETREKISAVIRELWESGKTIVTATHDLESLSSDFDAAFYLREGREAAPEAEAFTGIPLR
ncbi:MAG: ABC transporter ATP-binding protein [Rubrobacter sp.]|nr:ABC transporter ATP-binding protein [Rubrobacter sp.]